MYFPYIQGIPVWNFDQYFSFIWLSSQLPVWNFDHVSNLFGSQISLLCLLTGQDI